MKLAVAAAVAAGGHAGLAALSQQIARSLICPDQEEALAATMRDTFCSRFVPTSEPLRQAWAKVAGVVGQNFDAPQLVKSPLVYAQADSRNLYVGTEAMQAELAEPNVLIFTLAHEQAHRRNRDTAGAKGLETLLEICQDSPELFKPALAALHEGRQHNERLADAFAARVAAQLRCEPDPIAEFLAAIPEDSEHPPGRERAAAVLALMTRD